MKSLKIAMVCVLFIVIVCAFFSDVIFGKRILLTCNPHIWSPWKAYTSAQSAATKTYRTDSALTYLPRLYELKRAIGGGRLPLWNPHVFMGYPFFADPQSRVFYPISLLLSLGDPERALGFDVAIHLGIALMGMYAFLTSLGASKPGAVLGALTFGFSSFFFTRMGHPTFVATASWIPWQFFGFHLAPRRCMGKAVLLGALVLGYLAGFPQVFFLGVGALLFYAIWISVEEIVQRDRSRLFENVKILLIIGGIAFLIVSPQLLAFIEFIRNSRGLGIDFETMKTSYMSSPWVLLRVLVPGFFGNPVEGTSWLRLLNPTFHPYNEGFLVYAGVGSALVALGGLAFLKSSREIRAFWGLLVLACALALSSSLLKPFYVAIPFLRFSQIDRISVIACLSLSTVAALSFSQISEASRSQRRRFVIIVLVATTMILVGYLGFSINRYSIMGSIKQEAKRFGHSFWQTQASHRIWNWARSERPEWARFEAENLKFSLVMALVSGSLLLGYVMRRDKRWFPIVLGWVFVALTSGDLMKVARSYYVSQPSGSLCETEGIALLRELVSDGAGWRVLHYGSASEVLPANTNAIFEIPSISGRSTLVPEGFANYALVSSSLSSRSASSQEVLSLKDIACARYLLADTLYPEMLRSPILAGMMATLKRKPEVLAVAKEARLAFPLTVGKIDMEVVLPQAEGLEFYFAFESQSTLRDSIYLSLNVSNRLTVSSTYAFDSAWDAGIWHRLYLDISRLSGGRSKVEIELRSKHPAQPQCYLAGGDIVERICEVRSSQGGYTLEGIGKEGRILIDLSSHNPLLKLSLDWGDFKTVGYITFPPGWEHRSITIPVEGGAGRLRIEGDGEFEIARARVIETAEAYVPGFEVLYNGDMVIVENTRAIEKGIFIDKSRTVFHRKGDEILLSFDPSSMLRDEAGSCLILHYGPEHIEAEVTARREGYLLLQDVHYPGWKGYVDGRPTEVLPSYPGIRAIDVPAGKHRIIMEYRPFWMRLGLGLMVAGLIVGIIYVRKSS